MFCFLPTIRRIPPQSNEVPSSTGPWFFSCTKNGSKNGPVWITEVQYLLKLFLGSLNLSLTFFVSVGPCLNTWYTVEILKVENKFRLNKKMNTLFLPTANIYEPRFDNPPIYIYINLYHISPHWTGSLHQWHTVSYSRWIFRSPPPDADWKNWIVAVPFSPTPRTIVCLDKIPGDDEISPLVKTE